MNDDRSGLLAATDPAVMIRWLRKQGAVDPLWDFTLACCRRVWDERPGKEFRRVVEHFEQVGMHDIDDVLADAAGAIRRLERRFHKADEAEQRRISRQIGYGRMVFAFDYQDGGEAATAVSSDLVAWANDPETEQKAQADLLRLIAPDGHHTGAEDQDD